MADDERPGSSIGLCATCAFARRVTSARRSVFLLCGRSRTDQGYPKYPRLPVVRCPGYERRADSGAAPPKD
ncbi:MAG: hypothetical protein IVW36_10195 [Dehalococcoidia bacterium]|nr:hypothetical protein [Dehalococcoidia bacterium]